MRLVAVMAAAISVATAADAGTPAQPVTAQASLATAIAGVRLSQNDVYNFLVRLSPTARSRLLSECTDYLAAAVNAPAADRELTFCTIAQGPVPPP